jgi:hypothetical protein
MAVPPQNANVPYMSSIVSALKKKIQTFQDESFDYHGLEVSLSGYEYEQLLHWLASGEASTIRFNWFAPQSKNALGVFSLHMPLLLHGLFNVAVVEELTRIIGPVTLPDGEEPEWFISSNIMLSTARTSSVSCPDHALFWPGQRLPSFTLQINHAEFRQQVHRKAENWIQKTQGHPITVLAFNLRSDKSTTPDQYRIYRKISKPRNKAQKRHEHTISADEWTTFRDESGATIPGSLSLQARDLDPDMKLSLPATIAITHATLVGFFKRAKRVERDLGDDMDATDSDTAELQGETLDEVLDTNLDGTVDDIPDRDSDSSSSDSEVQAAPSAPLNDVNANTASAPTALKRAASEEPSLESLDRSAKAKKAQK